MSQRIRGITLNGAPSQYDRQVRSAAADSVLVDSRTSAELLSFAPAFGRLVDFYDTENRPDGDWSLFFLTDPTIILASIESLDIRGIEHRFFAALNQAKEGRPLAVRQERLRECLQELTALARLLDSWLKGAQAHAGSRPARLFSGHMVSAIQTSLAPALEGIAGTGADGPDLRGLSPQWSRRGTVAELPSPGHSHSKQPDRTAAELETVFDAFSAVIEHLKEFARKNLPETLKDSSHKPQIGLYIAFVQLFGYAQQTLNTLTGKFSKFYYSDILKERKAGPVPDSVYLTFALDPAAGVSFSSVPAGTQFPAGQEPDGSAVLYAADNEVTVSLAAIASLRALRQVTGPLYTVPPASPPLPADPRSPPDSSLRQIVATTIGLKLMNDEAAGKGPVSGPIPWPLFGNTGADQNTDIAATTPVTPGFVIASPYLMLTGGTRHVTVEFHMAGGFSGIEWELDALSGATGLGPEAVCEQVLESAFDIWLSTTKGWFHLDSYSSVVSPQTFSISFPLSSSAPPVTAFNPPSDAPAPRPTGPDSMNPVPEYPTLKAYLRQTPAVLTGVHGTVETYPLSLIGRIGIDSIRILTDTTGLSDLKVLSSSGQVDTSTPFPVFGGLPVVGSYLEFSHEELFVKEPDSGSVTIDLLWYGLPQNAAGFTNYYQGYVLGIDGTPSADPPLYTNRSFMAELRVVNPGIWSFSGTHASPPEPDAIDVFLFRASTEVRSECSFPTPPADGTLCPESVFRDLPVGSAVPPSYYDPASSAIRITLTQPPCAFGNVLYASNVLNAAIMELPRPPFTEAVTVQVERPNRTPVTSEEALSNAANSIDPVVNPGSGPPPSKSDIQALVQRIQEQLLKAAQTQLTAGVSGMDPAASGWVRQTFRVTGSGAAPYQARTIVKRLQSALQTIGPGGHFTSPPGLSGDATAAVQDAIRVLQGVVVLQQTLDDSAAEPDSQYLSSVQSGLASAQDSLNPPVNYADTSPPTPTAVIYPNAPWLPQAESLRVSYRAHCDFSPSATGEAPGSFFYLLPFGGYQPASASLNGTPLLPIPDPGVLELGFTGLRTEQSLSLLVQMAAASMANPPKLSWEYLAADYWVPFDAAQIPLDSTSDLQNTGVVTLNVPQATADPQTVSTDSYRWIRVVTQQPDDFAEAIGIYPNPASATWVSTAVDGEVPSGRHLSRPLPPYTIGSSVQNLPAVQLICQPVESFGGVPAETEATFSMRVAERLRHKDRAILPWDYEQLVLAHFQTIWKVQALSATSTAGPDSPGHVLVVVVAGPRSRQVADPTEPLATAEMLDTIQKYLVSLATPFAVIQAVNPLYVRITVMAHVLFGGPANGGGGIDELKSDLVQYLSPWFYTVERASMRGAYASEDAITQFIDTRPYVDSIERISFAYEPPREGQDWYFLTSAKSHSITEAAKPPVSVCQGGNTP